MDYEGKSHSPSLSDMGATLASLCLSDVFVAWPPLSAQFKLFCSANTCYHSASQRIGLMDE